MSTAIEFDFATRTCRTQDAHGAQLPDGSEHFLWVDLNLEAAAPLSEIAARLRFDPTVATCLAGGDAEPAMGGDPVEIFQLVGADGTPVRCAMTERALLSAHSGEVAWLRTVATRCPDDVRRFAQTRGFLLFEFGAALLRELRRAADAASAEAGQLAESLLAAPAAAALDQVARSVRELIALQMAAAGGGAVLADLGTRRSAVVPDTTQPHLRALAERFDRLADEMTVQREMLNDALQMHLGALAQRTNLIMQRLTIVGTIFLPLTFLTGIYGMNMQIPETQWPGMYAAFWVIALAIAGALLLMMRRWRWW